MDSAHIFKDAGIDPAKFYARSFKLSELQPAQCGIEGIGPELDSGEQPRLCLIESIVEGEGKDWEKKRLGKNLLDSFALIFAQPRSGGVVATILEYSGEESNDYTLWIAKNFVRDCPFAKLARKLETWFKDREERERDAQGHHIHIPTSQNNLWCTILRNCYPMIRVSLKHASKVKNAVESSIPCPQTVPKKLNDILRELDKYFPETRGPNIAQEWKNGGSALEQFLDIITRLCYDLLESNMASPNALFRHCCKESTHEIWWKKLRRLIYILANYRRAWYDIVRFKTSHESATLQIQCIPTSGYCTGNSIILSDIIREGKAKGIYESRSRAEIVRDYSILPKLERETKAKQAWPRVHCELRILDFLLENRDLKNVFNYIGCSKGPCWLCHYTLECMAPKIGMRACNLKLYPVWEPPRFQGSPQNRQRFIKVLQSLDKTIKDVLNREMKKQLKPRAYRYSNCKPDCPDIEETFLLPNTELMCQLEKE
ncbi:hypothetical protein F5Y05DRAFT_424595 [Hypoxylon sp. FL0543]|nr:hypothetical protein F5Y05DRAFT_424595 [Hypoxylon sp. FL0543]